MYSAVSHTLSQTSKLANQWVAKKILNPAQLVSIWDRLSLLPGGKKAFTKLLGTLIPYTGSIPVQIEELHRGHATVVMQDRRRARNHLSSLHAVALMNVAEMASGLALFSALPSDARGILKGFSIDYHKKARGPITAESQTPKVQSNDEAEYLVDVSLKDQTGEVVAVAKAKWRVGPTH